MSKYKVVATSQYECEVEGIDEDDTLDNAVKLFEEELGGLLYSNTPSLFEWEATEVKK